MNPRTAKVIDRMAGRDLAKIKREKKRIYNLHDNVWYRRWKDLADFLDKTIVTTGHRKALILREAFNLVEDCQGHHRGHIAWSSKEAMELVCKERGWK